LLDLAGLRSKREYLGVDAFTYYVSFVAARKISKPGVGILFLADGVLCFAGESFNLEPPTGIRGSRTQLECSDWLEVTTNPASGTREKDHLTQAPAQLILFPFCAATWSLLSDAVLMTNEAAALPADGLCLSKYTLAP
jgi:hypothetical protein